MTFESIQKHPRYQLSGAIDVVTASAEMHQLSAENISLGGMFLKTTRPLPEGSAVRLRLRSAGPGAATIGLVGRVVHVIDEVTSAKKAHPPGIGVQFDPPSPQTELLLRRFVEGLAAQAARERARRATVHFVSLSLVEVKTTRPELQQLWDQSLRVSGLFAEGDAPALGSKVRVVIGPIPLIAEVVHLVVGHGAGLQLQDLEGAKREALQRFLDGRDEHLTYEEAKHTGAPLGKVLAAARRLFVGIEEHDGFAAIGLPSTSTPADIRDRCALLMRVFETRPPEATPPQLARLDAARRALLRLETDLVHRAGALRREAELVKPADVGVVDVVRDLLAEAFHYEKSGQRGHARAVLTRALDIAPDDVRVQQRIAALDAIADLHRAAELLTDAENLQGVGLRHEAIPRAREAARICRRREIQLRALRVLAKANEIIEATAIAQELLVAEPRDPLALQALLHLYEKGERWSEAAGVGEVLLRQRAGDTELAKRVKKILERVRR
ncbi:MAG: PilZ domain-containing protein [Deltaproteobacteria bacterium]|nr:PilZ domain-containing protein [Deltaproteobacteria bacterium]